MLWNFFTQVYRLPMLVFKAIMANPMGIFVYGILSKWYIMVMVACAVTTFWVFKGLEESGVLQEMENTVRGGLTQVKAVAQHCTPKIRNLKEVWKCVNKDHKYTPGMAEKALDKVMETVASDNMKESKDWDSSEAGRTNPYDEGGGTP
jgi:hypothetical protein